MPVARLGMSWYLKYLGISLLSLSHMRQSMDHLLSVFIHIHKIGRISSFFAVANYRSILYEPVNLHFGLGKNQASRQSCRVFK
jgi:hypothetical protein